MATMPLFLSLGSRRIKLSVSSEVSEDAFGDWCYETGTISLHPTTTEKGIFSLHEFVHASLTLRGVELSEADEERVATVLGEDLHELMIRNPEFVAWIMSGSK